MNTPRRSVLVSILFMLRVAHSFVKHPISCRPIHRRPLSSVTGSVYVIENAPTVTLFTKEGCTLCDKVKDVLREVLDDQPHSLRQQDITDDAEIFERYKYDIPVLHLNGQYWTKHRLTPEDARDGLRDARVGTFQSPPGEPNAGKLERKR